MPDRTFIGHRQRVISRDTDGFRHCTAGEWALVCTLSDIALIEDNRD